MVPDDETNITLNFLVQQCIAAIMTKKCAQFLLITNTFYDKIFNIKHIQSRNQTGALKETQIKVLKC